MAKGILPEFRTPYAIRLRCCPHPGLLAEKDAEVKINSRHDQGVTPADCRKQEEPADDKENDYHDERGKRHLGTVLFHALRS